jgi:hypothetical protein
MRLNRSAALVMAAALLGGCTAATNGSGSPPPASDTPTSPATAAPSTTAIRDEPVPSAALGAFSCDLPVVDVATVERAIITDVRVGTHAGYDRVVFEFAAGLPEITLEPAIPPFTHDPSGTALDVMGSSFLRLTMRGGTKQTLEGTSAYDGPTDFDPGYPTLVDFVEGGDFEAVSTWYLGLTHESCVRVLSLTDDGAPRLVIDVEH